MVKQNYRIKAYDRNIERENVGVRIPLGTRIMVCSELHHVCRYGQNKNNNAGTLFMGSYVMRDKAGAWREVNLSRCSQCSKLFTTVNEYFSLQDYFTDYIFEVPSDIRQRLLALQENDENIGILPMHEGCTVSIKPGSAIFSEIYKRHECLRIYNAEVNFWGVLEADDDSKR